MAIDEAAVTEPLEKGCQPFGVLLARTRVQKSDHWHRGLLRTRRERPRDCRAAEKRDERNPVAS
jgi:hypothetical protein